MLRQNFTKIITTPDIYRRILTISCVVAFISWIALPLFPFNSDVGFMEENAVTGAFATPHNDVDRAYRIYNSITNLSSSNPEETLSYIEAFFLKNNVQPYRMDFIANSYTLQNKKTLKGTNLYGTYRTKRGDPSECNLISFSHDLSTKNGNGRFEIALALSLLEMFAETQKVNYNSRDLIFLAYDGRFKTYGKAVQEFLSDYYSDRNPAMDRCGVIRQAINIEIENDNFNKLTVLHQGLNGRVPDLDFFVLVTKIIESTIHPAFFESGISSAYEKKIGELLNQNYYIPLYPLIQNFRPLNFDTSLTLASLKGLLIGWPHDVHPYFLEKGILALTLKAYRCDTCSEAPQKEFVKVLGNIIEGVNRGLMSLQEQLHAGSSVWIATARRHIYFLFGNLLLVLPLPIAYAVKGLINYYEQDNNRNVLRTAFDQAGLIITLWIIYELPRIFEFGLSRAAGTEVLLCSTVKQEGIAYDPNFLLSFIISSTAILILGTLIFPKLLKCIFSQEKVEEYRTSHWKTKYALYAAYFIGSTIGWALVNSVFGLIGSFVFLPIVLLISPLSTIRASPKNLIGIVIALLWIGTVFIGLSDMIMETHNGWLDAIREVLMHQTCYGSDLYRFIVFYIIPVIVCAWQIITFRGK